MPQMFPLPITIISMVAVFWLFWGLTCLFWVPLFKEKCSTMKVEKKNGHIFNHLW